MDKINLELPVTVYGNIEKYNDVLSKARVRIFYKYGNRNGTYITDEFADLLLSTLPYAPVKGIYDLIDEDYTDHGDRRDLGRIYGIVPENPNISWEKNIDEDGVEREYACADVLLFTGLYKEADQIIGKSQSMEIYEKSIQGQWQFINGKKYFVFEKGSFLGLQVLGEEVEPCFEGASFFSLLEPIKELVQQYNIFQKQGGHKMNLNFKLSDGQKYEAIWSLLNPEYGKDDNWDVNYTICDIYDEYAIVKNLSENFFERVYYTKNDEEDSVVLGERVKCFIVDVTQEEKTALEVIKALNGGTYEKLDENYSHVTEENETLKNNYSEVQQKNEELEASLSTLTTERDTAQASYAAINIELEQAKTNIASLQADVYALTSFKTEVLKAQKKAIISSYTDKLSAEVLEGFESQIDTYDAEGLKKELAYAFVQSNPAVFTGNNDNFGYVPKEEPKSGIVEILSRYKK